ncbi:GGDEF domain-containing protein [Mycolicibacterium sphagni]|uniref:GGDEF domain-containing protein n=2 Tax=Mycolicibacterium sphagni TaxID=1786 RepID=A0ABX2JSI3_9MYCO|nr:GGDEF domain-containing protein [Mycolicibacterium sphagni]
MHKDIGMAAWIRRWWHQPDQYDWMSEYLASRHLQRFSRFLIASVVFFLGVVPVVMLFSPSGPQGHTHRTIAVAMSILSFGGACSWLAGWPSRRVSTLFAIGANAGVTVACLIAGTPATGLLACATFALIAGYVGLHHSSRLLAATLANAIVTTVLAGVRIAEAGDTAMAVGHVLGMLIAILAVPFGSQLLLHLLSLDARMSDTDSLTGLRNRRGYDQSVLQLIAGADRSQCLAVILIDLDDFKQINDTHGHGYGDAVLVAVADNLHRASAMDSVVARLGGEEFLIAELTGPDEPPLRAERLRAAVATTPSEVTASVGVASIALNDIGGTTTTALTALVDAADAAMYEAKRAGGNQVRHRTTTSPRA